MPQWGITEWIAVITFVSGLIFGFAKLYSVLQSILVSLRDIAVTLDESRSDRLELHRQIDSISKHVETQFGIYEERFKTVFNNLAELHDKKGD